MTRNVRVVFVRGLELSARIGLHAHEREGPQPLRLDLEVEFAAAPVERLEDTLDYALLAETARTLAGEGHVDLVETFVETLAERLAERLAGAPGVRRIRIRAEKPLAVPGADGAGVELRLELDGTSPTVEALARP